MLLLWAVSICSSVSVPTFDLPDRMTACSWVRWTPSCSRCKWFTCSVYEHFTLLVVWPEQMEECCNAKKKRKATCGRFMYLAIESYFWHTCNKVWMFDVWWWCVPSLTALLSVSLHWPEWSGDGCDGADLCWSSTKQNRNCHSAKAWPGDRRTAGDSMTSTGTITPFWLQPEQNGNRNRFLLYTTLSLLITSQAWFCYCLCYCLSYCFMYKEIKKTQIKTEKKCQRHTHIQNKIFKIF